LNGQRIDRRVARSSSPPFRESTPMRRLRQTARWTLLLCLSCSALTSNGISQRPSPGNGEDPSARLMPEVRMRKLHLVRPDLIPYPIAYEVYC
jgi:hypothetical protein